MPFIVEGLITTWNHDGTTNVAPQGPIVLIPGERLLLRPWQGSRTYDNLWRDRAAVFHLTDDVLLLAETAIGEPRVAPSLVPADVVDGMALADSLESWELVVEEAEQHGPRRSCAPIWNAGEQWLKRPAANVNSQHLNCCPSTSASGWWRRPDEQSRL